MKTIALSRFFLSSDSLDKIINAICKFFSFVVILRSAFCDEGSKNEILRPIGLNDGKLAHGVN